MKSFDAQNARSSAKAHGILKPNKQSAFKKLELHRATDTPFPPQLALSPQELLIFCSLLFFFELYPGYPYVTHGGLWAYNCPLLGNYEI